VVCEDADHLHRGHAALLDEEIEVLALAAGVVGGDLIDEEVLGALLERAADGGQVRGGEDAWRNVRVEVLQ
jgi:phosphopantetheine adenylyltransferase